LVIIKPAVVVLVRHLLFLKNILVKHQSRERKKKKQKITIAADEAIRPLTYIKVKSDNEPSLLLPTAKPKRI
jgi:hypothetical protein